MAEQVSIRLQGEPTPESQRPVPVYWIGGFFDRKLPTLKNSGQFASSGMPIPERGEDVDDPVRIVVRGRVFQFDYVGQEVMVPQSYVEDLRNMAAAFPRIGPNRRPMRVEAVTTNKSVAEKIAALHADGHTGPYTQADLDQITFKRQLGTIDDETLLKLLEERGLSPNTQTAAEPEQEEEKPKRGRPKKTTGDDE